MSRFLNTSPSAHVAVFLLAVVVHLVVIGRGFWLERYAPESYDEARYVFYAESIRAGRGMHAPGYEDRPTAYVMPALPLLFAAIGADSLVRLRLLQLILSALVAVVTFELGRRLYESTALGWVAVLLLLANLGWVLQPLYLLTEPLFTLLLALTVLILIYYPQRWRGLSIAGVLLGLAWLTRGALIGSMALIFLFLWWRVGFRKMVFTGLVMSLVIAPWIIRNYAAFGAFLATSTQSGNVVAGAYNDEIYQNPWGDGWINPTFLDEGLDPAILNDEVAYTNYQVSKGREWIFNNPQKLPKLWAAHVFGFVRPWFKIARTDIEFLYVIVSWWVAAGLLAVGGGYALRTRNIPLLLMLVVIGGGFATGLIFFAIPRYRLPYAPYFALLQTAGVWVLLRKAQAQQG